MVSHEHQHLVYGHRLPVGPVVPHVQLNNDGLEMFPPLLVRDVEAFVVVRTREETIDVHTVGGGARRRVALTWNEMKGS